MLHCCCLFIYNFELDGILNISGMSTHLTNFKVRNERKQIVEMTNIAPAN